MRELKLRPYQEAARQIAHDRRKVLLALDMGLGKTAVSLQVMHDAIYDYCDTDRWCVVAPKLVASDAWPRQLRMWRQFQGLSWRVLSARDFGLEPLVRFAVEGVEIEAPYSQWQAIDPKHRPPCRKLGLTFGTREDKAAVKRVLRGMREQVHLVSWDFFDWLTQAYGKNWPYQGLVLDESLAVANSTSTRHRAAWHVTQRLDTTHRLVLLTGTPAPDSVEQWHGQLRLIDGGQRLGRTKTEFTERWLAPDKLDRRTGRVWSWKLANGVQPTFERLIGEVSVSLKSEDYLQLPPNVVAPTVVEMPQHAQELYERMERDLIIQLGDADILAPSQAALTIKLRQLANGQVYDSDSRWHAVHDVKLQALLELLEAAPGPVLLAYSFKPDWERIKARVKGAVHVRDPGALDKFRTGKVKLMCLHPASGAEGLDGLQEVSSTAVWYGATYVARHWLQFNKRLHRDGQRAGRVVTHQILAGGTIEEWVAGRVLPDKIEEADGLLAAIKWRAETIARA